MFQESPSLASQSLSHFGTARALSPRGTNWSQFAWVWRAGPSKWHWSGQDDKKYIKQNGVAHVNQNSFVSHDTLVQEENYTRHAWQGDTHLNICTHDQYSCACTAGPHTDRLLGNSPLAIRGAKTLIKRPGRVGHTILKGRTEAGSRPLLRSQAPHTQVLLHAMLISLGISCWRLCPAGLRTSSGLAHLALETLPCKMLTAPLLTVLCPGPAD